MYFNWSTYPFRRPPELDGQRGPRPSVLVVGAGPTGLTLALCLARLGVASVVVEARDAVSRGSRAAGINRRSLQVFDRIGVADTVLRHALRRNGTHNSTHWGDRLLHRSAFDDPAHEPHPAVVMLQQCWVEQILVDRALASPLIDLRWSTRVESVTPGPEGVEVALTTPEGPYTLAADHLVAADGAHSAVRRALGLRYDGVRHDEPFVIIDFSMPDALEAGRRVWFDPPYDPRATTLLHRLPFDVWRLDALVAGADDPAREAEPERARQRVAAHLAMMGVAAPWEFIEASLYRISMLSLPAYSAGRICFAGDAAHLMPIWSGRGMNHGIEDACNLAWKFAAVLQGRAPASLLNSYSHERQAVVHATLRPLARTTRFMTASSRGLKAMRNAVLSRSADCARARELFDAHRIVEAPYPLVGTGGDSGFSGGPAVGTLVPDRWIDGSTSLHQLLGSGFTGLYFAPDSGMPDGVAQQLDALLDDWPGATLLVIGGASSAQTRQPARARPVHDEHQMLRQLFGAGPGSFYLVRPDDRVAARWPSFDADAARSAYAAAQAGVVAAPAQAEAETSSAKDRLEDALLALADQIDVLPEQQAPVLLAELHRLLAAASAA